MKKISTIFILAVASLCFMTSASAQTIRFGIKGGVNLSGSNVKNVVNTGLSETYTGFNAGIALNIKLILGFSIQPELVYSQTGMKFNEETLPSIADITTIVTHGTIELPVNIQWGIKLGPVRPYIQASPYIAYSVLDRIKIVGSIEDIQDVNKFQYGMGLGFGIDIWKFQLSYKYKWDLNSFSRNEFIEGMGKTKIRGSEINLVFFF